MWRLTRQEWQVVLAVVALLAVGAFVKACRHRPRPSAYEPTYRSAGMLLGLGRMEHRKAGLETGAPSVRFQVPMSDSLVARVPGEQAHNPSITGRKWRGRSAHLAIFI